MNLNEYEVKHNVYLRKNGAECTVLTLANDAIATFNVIFNLACEIDADVRKLSDDQLIKMNLGAFDPKGSVASMIGNAGFTVAGAAGQTFMEAKEYEGKVTREQMQMNASRTAKMARELVKDK